VVEIEAQKESWRQLGELIASNPKLSIIEIFDRFEGL
jgi:hypothetical protein